MASAVFEWVRSVGSLLEWGKLIATFLAAAAATFVAYKFGKIQADIGRRQAQTAALSMKTARNKLRLDLFDRRVKIYDAARFAIEDAQIRNGKVTSEMVLTFGEKCIPAKWLFEPDVSEYLQEIKGELWKLRELSVRIPPEDRIDIDTPLQVAGTLSWFRLQSGRLDEVMAPYLLFTDRDIRTKEPDMT